MPVFGPIPPKFGFALRSSAAFVTLQMSHTTEEFYMATETHGGNRAAEAITPCLNCGETLLGRGCKLICPRCHFFFSCSDLEPMPQQAPEHGNE